MELDNHIIDSNSPLEKQIHDVRTFRKWTYPSAGDQLDMIWHAMDDDVISGKGSIWYNAIKQVKDSYPVQEIN